MMYDVSTTSVILTVVNVLLAMGLGYITWSMRRFVRLNDEKINHQDSKIDKLTGAIEAERETRHQYFAQLTDRVWGVSADIKENYHPRREALRQFGTLCQKIDSLSKDLTGRMDSLPCRSLAPKSCPAQLEINSNG